jgi:hypothetical protein
MIHDFLIKHGWALSDQEDGCESYCKEGCVGIDVCTESDYFTNEIVLLDESGDFLHIPLDIYSLIGALVYHRQIPFNFSS